MNMQTLHGFLALWMVGGWIRTRFPPTSPLRMDFTALADANRERIRTILMPLH